MSRIGVKSIKLGPNTTFDFSNGIVTIKGPKGTLKQEVSSNAKIEFQNKAGVLHLVLNENTQEQNAMHGLYRSLLANMVLGVEKGFEKRLIVNGVGYKVAMQGNTLVMNIGFSKPVNFDTPIGVKISVAGPTEIVVEGCDKTVVGQCAADIKAKRKPEPYHGYGIRYKDEIIIRKEIKAAAK